MRQIDFYTGSLGNTQSGYVKFLKLNYNTQPHSFLYTNSYLMNITLMWYSTNERMIKQTYAVGLAEGPNIRIVPQDKIKTDIYINNALGYVLGEDGDIYLYVKAPFNNDRIHGAIECLNNTTNPSLTWPYSIDYNVESNLTFGTESDNLLSCVNASYYYNNVFALSESIYGHIKVKKGGTKSSHITIINTLHDEEFDVNIFGDNIYVNSKRYVYASRTPLKIYVEITSSYFDIYIKEEYSNLRVPISIVTNDTYIVEPINRSEKDVTSLTMYESWLLKGDTSQRPNNPNNGFQYFDTTLGKPIYWNGIAWVDATGTPL